MSWTQHNKETNYYYYYYYYYYQEQNGKRKINHQTRLLFSAEVVCYDRYAV
jgi:hypothetical protein